MIIFTQLLNPNLTDLLPLLLEADEDQDAIQKYFFESDVYALQEADKLLAIACVQPLADNRCELKNIAVLKQYRRKGLGARLARALFARYTQQGFTCLFVGTGDISPGPIDFYLQLGFVKCGVRKDFFTLNYPKPMYENGVLLTDMTLLQKTLGPVPAVPKKLQ